MNYFNFVIRIKRISFAASITYDAISIHNPCVIIRLISHQGVESLLVPIIIVYKSSRFINYQFQVILCDMSLKMKICESG